MSAIVQLISCVVIFSNLIKTLIPMKQLIICLSLTVFISFSAFSQIEIDNSGNVGIGTSTPTHKLSLKVNRQGFSHEAYDTLIQIGTYVDGTFGAFIQTHTNHPLNLSTNNRPSQMTLLQNGKIGIGTISPTQLLDVNGKLRVRDVSLDNTKDSVLVVSGDGTVSYRDASSLLPTGCGLAIGDSTAGGIIFYLDASGCHGLICASTDQSSSTQWYNGTNLDTRAYGSGAFEGKYNTKLINIVQQGLTSAAAICYAYSGGGFIDWYLPSIHELNLMYLNIGQGNSLGLGNIGGFANSEYWSSTEIDVGRAWVLTFGSGYQWGINKSGTYRVRAFRAF